MIKIHRINLGPIRLFTLYDETPEDIIDSLIDMGADPEKVQILNVTAEFDDGEMDDIVWFHSDLDTVKKWEKHFRHSINPIVIDHGEISYE